MIDLYFLTYNAPEQLEHTIQSIENAYPAIIDNSTKYVVNNSTDVSFENQYNNIFDQYSIKEFKKDNIGICGGRQFVAEHFANSTNKYMLFFEDDMSMNGPDMEAEYDRLGFKKYHKGLYYDLIGIMEKENYDFLKLSFCEFYGDHQKQWSWYNVTQETREKIWPNNNRLPKIGRTEDFPFIAYKHIKSYNKLAYAEGQIYYSNWPMIINKKGNKKIFLDNKLQNPYEQTWMRKAFELTLENKLNPAVLLATTIHHERTVEYDKKTRKES